VNINDPSARRLACIDCHFGPPPEVPCDLRDDDEEDLWDDYGWD